MKTQEKKTTKQDVFLLLKEFERSIKRKPPIETMIKEITMMGFKIKTLLGDFSAINFSNKKVIEALWSLGKFDDFFQEKIGKINENEQQILLQYFDHLKKKLILSTPPHQTFKTDELVNNFSTHIFEIEILRPTKNPKKVN
jgi:hypothetical protein